MSPLLACVGGLLSLSSCGSVGDGAADAGAREAGRDASVKTDAGRDAGVDSGPHDAGAVEPEWIPLEGLPAGCELSMAADPESKAGPLRFEPCPDMAGCRQLVVDWTSRQEPRFAAVSGAYRGEHGYFVFVRGAELDWLWAVIAREDGQVLAVIRYPFPSGGDGFRCTLFEAIAGEGHAAITVATNTRGEVGDSIIGLLRGTGGLAFEVLSRLTPRVLGTNNYVSRTVLGEDFVAGQVVLRNDIIRVGFDGSVRWVPRPESGSPSLDAAAGHAVFYGT